MYGKLHTQISVPKVLNFSKKFSLCFQLFLFLPVALIPIILDSHNIITKMMFDILHSEEQRNI